MTKSAAPEADILPRRSPPWTGLIAAVVTAGGYYAAGMRGFLPSGQWGTSGRLATVVHALTALAVVALLVERFSLSAWAATLRSYEHPGEGSPASPNWVTRALDLSTRLLRKRPSHEERQAAIEEVRATLERDLARRWRWPRDLAFVIPVLGCLLSLLNLRMVSNVVPWSEVGMPLVLATGESALVILLATWVARDARSALMRWRLAAEGLSTSQLPDGLLDQPDEELDDEPGSEEILTVVDRDLERKVPLSQPDPKPPVTPTSPTPLKKDIDRGKRRSGGTYLDAGS